MQSIPNQGLEYPLSASGDEQPLQGFDSVAHNDVAIAHGNLTPKEIAGYIGLADNHVPAYLAKLVEPASSSCALRLPARW